MRFTTPAINSALLTSVKSSSYRLAQRQAFGGLRQYSSQPEAKKGGSKVLIATLLGAGVIGGLVYNSSQTKVVPVDSKKETKKEKLEELQEKPTAFNPEAFIPLKLKQVETVSHDTHLYRFALPDGQSANLPVASCVLVKHTPEGGKPIIRPYTPVSDRDAEGHVDFVIKTYKTGKLTPIINSLKPGDELHFKGPMPKYNWDKDQKANVGMIAGGTGITPMLQVIRRVFHEKSNDKNTKVTLIFANQTENDILLRDELDRIAKAHPDRFKVVYALDKAPDNWQGIKGYVTKDVIQENLPSPKDKDHVIMVCGPPPMVASIAGPKDKMEQGELQGVLKELGYQKENVFKF